MRGKLVFNYLLIWLAIIIGGIIIEQIVVSNDEIKAESSIIENTSDVFDNVKEEEASLITVNIKYDSAELIYNNHVGNEWSKSVKVNENYLYKSNTVDLNVYDSENIVVYCYANENDKIMDYGSGNIVINPDALKNGQNIFTCDVIVVENRGRYSGNTACWRFKIIVTKKE